MIRKTLPGSSQDACLKDVRLKMELPCSLRIGDVGDASQSGFSSDPDHAGCCCLARSGSLKEARMQMDNLEDKA